MESNSKKTTIVGNYQLNTRIGCGAYAEVFSGIDIRNEKSVAVKVIARNKISHTKLQENLQSEIAILRDFNHINIVRLVDHFNSSKYIFLVLELCEGGDLSKFIKKYKSISEELSIRFLKQIASGLLFLSHKSLIHRDLKPANILLTEFSENAILKLADFGFAKELKDADKMTQTRCGTPLYMSPEVLENQEYDSKIDIWSAGIIFYEMLVGTTPFKGVNEVDLLKTIKTKSLSLPSNINISKESIILMKGLLERNPIRRISLDNFCDALSHFSDDLHHNHHLVNKPILDNTEMNSSTSTKQRGSDLKLNPSTATTMVLTVAENSAREENPNNTRETNVQASVTTHRRYSSDQSDTFSKTKINQCQKRDQKNWLPVSSIGSNLGKAIIQFAQPSYKSRVRSSSADAVIDGFYSGFGRPQKMKSFKSDVSAEDDFVIIDSNFSQSQKKKETLCLTPPQSQMAMDDDNDAVLTHLQNSNHLCDIISVIISIADNLIKDSTPQKKVDSVETDAIIDDKRSRGNSNDCQFKSQYINACSLYLHVLQLLNNFILANNSLAKNSLLKFHEQALQQISLSLLQYVDILILRVEQCLSKLSLVASPCVFPSSPLVLYKAAIKIANDATVAENFGNLESALNNYSNARTLLQYVIAKVHDNNDKNILKQSFDIISNQYDLCELHFLSQGNV